MKLQDEIIELEERMIAIREEQKLIPVDDRGYMGFTNTQKYVSLTTEYVECEIKLGKLNEALFNYNPHDEYWEVIEHCIDSDITPEFLMEIITIWRAMP